MTAKAAQRVFTGAPWEEKVGYCRAIRRGDMAFVSGCTAVREDGGVFGRGDAEVQAKRCLQVAVDALARLDVRPEDIVRTRMFVTDISMWEAIGRAHVAVFGAHPPATSMVEVARLIHPDMLVEIEVDAVAAELVG